MRGSAQTMQFTRFILLEIKVVREQDGGIQHHRDRFLTTEGDCGAMKIVILITVIESSAVMLAIMYFYYTRSQSERRALVLRRRRVSFTEQAKLVSPPGVFLHRSLVNQSGHSHDPR